VVLRDITKQKQAEEALQQAERKYRLIFEEAMVGLCQTTPDGRVLSANPAMARLYGFDRRKSSQPISATSDPNFMWIRRDGMSSEIDGSIRDGAPPWVQVYRKDGSKMWLTREMAGGARRGRRRPL